MVCIHSYTAAILLRKHFPLLSILYSCQFLVFPFPLSLVRQSKSSKSTIRFVEVLTLKFLPGCAHWSNDIGHMTEYRRKQQKTEEQLHYHVQILAFTPRPETKYWCSATIVFSWYFDCNRVNDSFKYFFLLRGLPTSGAKKRLFSWIFW